MIGNGSFGVVYQAKLCETGEMVAIKKVLQVCCRFLDSYCSINSFICTVELASDSLVGWLKDIFNAPMFAGQAVQEP